MTTRFEQHGGEKSEGFQPLKKLFQIPKGIGRALVQDYERKRRNIEIRHDEDIQRIHQETRRGLGGILHNMGDNLRPDKPIGFQSMEMSDESGGVNLIGPRWDRDTLQLGIGPGWISEGDPEENLFDRMDQEHEGASTPGIVIGGSIRF